MSFLRNDPILKQRRRDLRRDQTEAEKAFWLCVRNKQLYGLRFVRQYSIGPYILDFFCPVAKLAIELDGGQHNESDNREYDEARTKYLNSLGIEMIRFWNHEVLLDIQSVLRKVAAWIETQHNSPCPPLNLRGGTKNSSTVLKGNNVNER
jgi:very-short-patch-repair endonuclease